MSQVYNLHRGGDRPYIWFLGITFFVIVLETVGGIESGSLALIADAWGHAPVHLIVAGLAIWAWRKGQRTSSEKSLLRTKRINKIVAILIVSVALKIGWNAVFRLWAGDREVLGWWALVIAVLGLMANAVQYKIVGNCNCLQDMALLTDISSDFLMSVAIVVSSLLIGLGASSRIDAGLTLIAIGLIIPMAWGLFRGKEHH